MSVLAVNRRATFDYDLIEKYEAGIALLGQEVKSIKNGRVSLEGAFVALQRDGPFLVNAAIPAYQSKNAPQGYNPARSRRLLLHKSEIKKLIGARAAGLTLIPLKIYTKGPKIKLEFALARARKKHDKRARLREREDYRKIQQVLKNT